MANTRRAQQIARYLNATRILRHIVSHPLLAAGTIPTAQFKNITVMASSSSSSRPAAPPVSETMGQSRKRQKTLSQPFQCHFAHQFPFDFPGCAPHPEKPRNRGQPVANVYPRVGDALQHLDRGHALPLHCEVCSVVFTNDQEGGRQYTAHLRANNCRAGTRVPLVGMTLTQRAEIKTALESAKKGKAAEASDVDRWYLIHRILFGENKDTIPKSPFASPRSHMHDAIDHCIATFLRGYGDQPGNPAQILGAFRQHVHSKSPYYHPDHMAVPAAAGGPAALTTPVEQHLPPSGADDQGALAHMVGQLSLAPDPEGTLDPTHLTDRHEEFPFDDYVHRTYREPSFSSSSTSSGESGPPAVHDDSPPHALQVRQGHEVPVDPILAGSFANDDGQEKPPPETVPAVADNSPSAPLSPLGGTYQGTKAPGKRSRQVD